MERVGKQTEYYAWLWRALKLLLMFNECFGQGQTTRQGIGWNRNKLVPFSKMSNKQQRGKLTELTRQEAEDKRIVMLLKYNMQNGFLNWGKLEMEMECDDLTWKKVLTQYSDRLLSFCIEFTTQHSANTK